MKDPNQPEMLSAACPAYKDTAEIAVSDTCGHVAESNTFFIYALWSVFFGLIQMKVVVSREFSEDLLWSVTFFSYFVLHEVFSKLEANSYMNMKGFKLSQILQRIDLNCFLL